MTDEQTQPTEPVDSPDEHITPASELLDTSSYRLSDSQALAALGAWLVFRAITQRTGFAAASRFLTSGPWVLPLLNNSMVMMVVVGMGMSGTMSNYLTVGAASVGQGTVAGLVLYWAGWRFGPELAKQAETGHAVWASVWNPKQVERAHRWIEKYGIGAVAIGRSFEWFTVPVMLVAGSARMTRWKFVVAHTVGAVFFAASTLTLAGVAKVRWPWLEDRIQDYARWGLWISLGLLVLLAVGFLFAGGSSGDDDDPGHPGPDA